MSDTNRFARRTLLKGAAALSGSAALQAAPKSSSQNSGPLIVDRADEDSAPARGILRFRQLP